jgi:hypothetical protein
MMPVKLGGCGKSRRLQARVKKAGERSLYLKGRTPLNPAEAARHTKDIEEADKELNYWAQKHEDHRRTCEDPACSSKA